MDDRYRQLAALIGLGSSERIARLFEMLCDQSEAEILLSLPAQAKELAPRLKMTQPQVQGHLNTLFRKGLVFPSPKTDPPTFRAVRDLVQFHDATILWPEAPPAFLDLWREFMAQEWFELARVISQKRAKPFTRIIPVGVALPVRSQILDFESVKEMVERAGKLAVTACTCRLSMRNCDRPLEVCLQVDRAAEYTLARGTGRKINKQQALDILKTSEQQGLIHVTMNRHKGSNFICNCCPCCCQTMPVLIKGGVKVVDPSRFRAQVDQELCAGCGLCQERCYFRAISWSGQEGSVSRVDPDKCMGCGLCLVTCPEGAMELVEVRPRDFVPGAA